ncbi:putative transcription factor & chromatin remodeling &Metalloenzymes JmjC family [Medicago truncatula]|uniref:Putative transcription factor & chromatin remodeling &Metalloenzymes JmjC family n=2 Tax=Medicago truncatula TaxID=3880 RepID=G7J3X8_MEDTR|nr:F-box protein At1g78280 isoform X1 [Medicago truncatula]AES73073.2 transferring glycosyl group transferase [Medicago truncatula]RHN70131.1 putative transcription factor & chromatin remodeling &Metalloenzymes JmjC family [Medicago truncatula]
MDSQQAHTHIQRDRRIDALGDLRVLPDEILCSILERLTPQDAARVACVSSVMYILSNEEPLWMTLCLRGASGFLQYKGSWKKTALNNLNLSEKYKECHRQQPLHFDGFNSLFLYRRLYRCHTTLDTFYTEGGNVERINDISLKDFSNKYDMKKPVMLNGLADAWPARQKWTTDQLLQNYGDVAFKISQRSSKKVSMKFKDYVSYMEVQHDEDPLYIFDEKFGEHAPSLLKDYCVPHLFQEDLFDILDTDKRPSYRWLIIGPQRSGASWHVDPALTSAWNTLLSGRKRWALYPPGKVPLGVTVHVNEEDGDVSIETPSSLQWWLDFYPLLADEDKPIECTQLPGETIYVPSGWWHCILNLETTIAVTQNFVNSNNFEFVCLDMAPGYRHKGVCRVGLLALEEDDYENVIQNMSCNEENLSYSDLSRKEKRSKTLKDVDDLCLERNISGASRSYNLWKGGFSYDINFLSMFLDKDRDHYNFEWSSGNSIGQRELREWLSKLWIQKPDMRDLIWKGACIALNAGKWVECLSKICAFNNLPPPTDDERLPVGSGSNPVYLVGNYVVKIFVEEGLEASLYGLGTELEFYSLLLEANSPLRKHIPSVMASGVVYLEDGSYTNLSWDGKGVPSVILKSNIITEKCNVDGFPFGVWGKQLFEYRNAGVPVDGSVSLAGNSSLWPYLIIKRCEGNMFADLRDRLSWEDKTNLASFLGEQMRHLHLLPHPPLNNSFISDIERELNWSEVNGCIANVNCKSNNAAEWGIFTRILKKKRKDVSSRLTKWGDPIPSKLIEKIDVYLPSDLSKLLNINENFSSGASKQCSWIHTDIMDDNIYMEPSSICSTSSGNTEDAAEGDNGLLSDHVGVKSWCPSYLLDFSDLSLGDPIFDLIPIYLDVFRGDSYLLKQFLESYKLPFSGNISKYESTEGGLKFGRLSYVAMCYCILHDDNVLGAIFSIWDKLRSSESWEEVEMTVWGELNNYKGFL